MKSIKAKDLRDKTVPELEDLVKQERLNLFNARRDLVFRRVTDTKSLSVRRHNIARMLTIIEAKKKGDDNA